jgi:hypothetical protein
MKNNITKQGEAQEGITLKNKSGSRRLYVRQPAGAAFHVCSVIDSYPG